jgi:hypothetical protein
MPSLRPIASTRSKAGLQTHGSRMRDPNTLRDDVAQFILNRLADDARTAEAATRGPWHARSDHLVADGYVVARRTAMEDTYFIARHDPERALAQCTALRITTEYLLAQYAQPDPHADAALYVIACVWSDHPAFDPAWLTNQCWPTSGAVRTEPTKPTPAPRTKARPPRNRLRPLRSVGWKWFLPYTTLG